MSVIKIDAIDTGSFFKNYLELEYVYKGGCHSMFFIIKYPSKNCKEGTLSVFYDDDSDPVLFTIKTGILKTKTSFKKFIDKMYDEVKSEYDSCYKSEGLFEFLKDSDVLTDSLHKCFSPVQQKAGRINYVSSNS